VFSTLVGILGILAFVLPGFVMADLAQSRRATKASFTDWELILRALSYSVVLHLAAGPWTRSVVLKLQHGEWSNHLNALIPYIAIVIVVAPVLLGLGLNRLLLGAERRGSLRPIHYALGGRDARSAWDFIFQRLEDGGWVVIRLSDTDPPSTFAAKFGKSSWATQSPVATHDLYLEEIWTLAADGTPETQVHPRQGVWLNASQIESMFFLDPPRLEST
jgi:hypothetical protein